MDLQDLKRWHWMVIGLLAGILWAMSQLFYGFLPDGETVGGTFEMMLMTTRDAPAFVDFSNVYVTDVQIHPPVTDDGPAANASATRGSIQWVTGTMVSRGFRRETREWRTRSFRYKAAVPFAPTDRFNFIANDWVPNGRLKKVPGYVKPTATEYPSIRYYFDELNRKYGSASMPYRYIWWQSRLAVMTLYPLGGLLLIGGIWPTVIALMVGAGLGAKAKPETFDLSRYKNGTTADATKGVLVTEQDRERLAAMNAELEKNLQVNAKPTGTVSASPTAPAIRKLEGESTDVSKLSEQKPQAAKAFGASRTDFYPTEIHPDEKKS